MSAEESRAADGAVPPGATGDPEVDDVLATVAAASGTGVERRAAVLDEAHRRLRARLDDADE